MKPFDTDQYNKCVLFKIKPLKFFTKNFKSQFQQAAQKACHFEISTHTHTHAKLYKFKPITVSQLTVSDVG